MASEKSPTKIYFNADSDASPRLNPSPGLFPWLPHAFRAALAEGGSAAGSDGFSHIIDFAVSSDTEVVSSVSLSPRAESPQLSYETDSEPSVGVERPFADHISELSLEPVVNLPSQESYEYPKNYISHRAPASGVINFAGGRAHPRHYYSDGHFTFEVEGIIYRIHRHIGEISTAFAGDLAAGDRPCQSLHHQKAGISVTTQQPTHIDTTITTAEIEALLDLLYTPFYAAKSIKPETYRLALPLCIKWGLEELRVAILSELEKGLDLFDRYALARELEIPEWEKYCLSALVIRPMGLTLDEGRRLGVDAVVFISTLREDARTRSQCLHTCVSCDLKKHSTGRSVDIAFVHERVQEWMERTR
ncbi:hypothetical protein FRC12_007712 [Ceratobasidium sp. 428]|nr:hypothetical protein FRC12_007712 [Ceratobasidium sp. 428]